MENYVFMVPTCETSIFNDKSVCANCINSIIKYYPNNNIIIINDSLPNIASNETIIKFFNNDNIKVISADTRGSACSYAMNYLLNSEYKYGIVIHDSTELINYLPELNFDIKFFWYFTEHYEWDKRIIPKPHRTKVMRTHTDEIINFYVNLDDSEFKRNFIEFYKKKDLWRGCMGNMLIINRDFLKKIEEKTKILSLSKFVVTRRHRMCMESIFAMAVFYTQLFDFNDEFNFSLHGNWNMINNSQYCNYLYKKYKFINKFHLKR